MAFVLVLSLAAVPAYAASDTDTDTGALSAELVVSAQGLELFGKVILDPNQLMLGATAGMAVNGIPLADVAAALSAQALAAEGTLLGGAYGVRFDTLAENLPGSIFAPDSGSDYALDQETYDQLLALFSGGLTQTVSISGGEDAAVQQAAQTLVVAFLEPLDRAVSNVAVRSGSASVIINGKPIQVTQTRYTADGDVIYDFLEDLAGVLEEDAQVQSALAVLIDRYADVSGEGQDVTGEEAVRSLMEQLPELLEEARTTLTEEGISVSAVCCLSAATQTPVKLALELEDNYSTLEMKLLMSLEQDYFRLELAEDGIETAAFQLNILENTADALLLRFAVSQEGGEEASAQFTLNKKGQAFLLSLYSDGERTDLSGFYTLGDSRFSLTVDQLDGEELGGAITLNLRADDAIAMPDFADITRLSQEEFDAVVQRVTALCQGLSQMLE